MVIVSSVVFGWSRAVISLLLLYCSFPAPLARESSFCWGFFHLWPLVFPGWWLLQLQVREYETKRKPRDLTFMLFLGSWGPRLVYVLFTLQSLLVLVLYITPRVFKVVFSRKNRKKISLLHPSASRSPCHSIFVLFVLFFLISCLNSCEDEKLTQLTTTYPAPRFNT